MSEKTKVNTYEIDGVAFRNNKLLYRGFLKGLGYVPSKMMYTPFSSNGYRATSPNGDIFTAWNSPEDWEAVLNTLPLVQI